MADKGAGEKLLWSIALPGLGQLLNKKYAKGIMVIFLELLILREKKNFFRGFAIKREKEMRQ